MRSISSCVFIMYKKNRPCLEMYVFFLNREKGILGEKGRLIDNLVKLRKVHMVKRKWMVLPINLLLSSKCLN